MLRQNLAALIGWIERIENKNFIVRFQEVGYVQDSNKIVAMYAVQMALEVALKNSMMSSNLKVYGKSPRFFYLNPDPRQIDRLLGSALAREYDGVSDVTKRNAAVPEADFHSDLLTFCVKFRRKVNSPT